MSKRPRWGGADGVQRVCALCGHGMPDLKPVFLIKLTTGQMVGPYHSGCAAKLANLYWQGERTEESIRRGAAWYGQQAREETLPE